MAATLGIDPPTGKVSRPPVPALGLCQCGCGERTSIAPQTARRKGWIRGEPLRFVPGHAARKKSASLPGLSVRDAAKRLGITQERLHQGVEAGFIRVKQVDYGGSRKVPRFDEKELAEDAAAAPRCRYGDCARIAFGASGCCGYHENALRMTGKKRPPEVGAKISEAKRQYPAEERWCELCGAYLGRVNGCEIRHGRERFCSRSCRSRYLWGDPDFRRRASESMGKAQRRRLATPEGQAQLAKARAALGRWREHIEESDRRAREDNDLLDGREASALAGISKQLFDAHVYRELLQPARLGRKGVTRSLFERQEVERYRREWARGGDGRRTRWLEPEDVLAQYRAYGWLDRFAAEHGLSEQEAEAVVRTRTQDRRKRLLRHRRGRRARTSPSAHHLRWAAEFDRLRAELDDYYRTRSELGLLDEGEPPPTDWQVLLAVAEADFSENPACWANYPASSADPEALDPTYARRAADRIWKAVKPLQTAPKKITSA